MQLELRLNYATSIDMLPYLYQFLRDIIFAVFAVHEISILEISLLQYVTGSEKTRFSGIFYILRNTSFKYSSHSGLLMPNCRDAKFTA